MPYYPASATGLQYATYPAGPTAAGATVTTGTANVKGAYTEMVASSPFACNMLVLTQVSGAAQVDSILVDVAIGASGSETVIVSNLLMCQSQGSNGSGANSVVELPLAIPSGTRIAIRAQRNQGITGLTFAITLQAAGDTPGFATFTSYGTSTTTSRGTGINAGGTTLTKGAYSEITPSIGLSQYLVVCLTSAANLNPASSGFKVDISTGAGGAETVFIPDLAVMSVNIDGMMHHHFPLPTYIPAGTRMSARCAAQTTDATDRVIEVGLLSSPMPSTVATVDSDNGMLLPHFHIVDAGAQGILSNPVRYAWTFRAPRAGTLNRAGFRFNAAGTPNTMKASFQNVNASVMRPDETIDQFRTFTPAVGWIATGLMTDTGADGGVKRVVTKGELISLVIEWDGAAGSVQLQPYGNNNEHWKPNVWHYTRTSGGVWNSAAGLATGNFAIQYDDNVWHPIDGVLPVSSNGTHTFGSTSSPDEYALRFIAPFTGAVLKGFHSRMDLSGPFEVRLYDASGNILTVARVTDTAMRPAAFTAECYIELNDRIELTGGQIYRLAFLPTSSTTIILAYADVPSNDYLNMWPMGQECYQSSRSNEGSWTDLTTRRLSVNLVWSDQIPLPVVPATPSESPQAIIEACFGVAPSGKLGYRNWIKEHPDVIAHWYLSDVGPVGAEDAIYPNDAGLYNGGPGKGRGLLPEFGLSTRFDGVDDFVEVDYDGFGLGTDAPFTFIALVRPREVTSAAARCIHMSGDTGGYLALSTTGAFTFGKKGGTTISLTEAVAAEGAYLVIGKFNGTTATLKAWDLLATREDEPTKRGVLVDTATGALTIGPHGGSDAFIGKGGSEEFFGDIQGVACIGAELSADEEEELLECCIWTDITGDARTDAPIDCTRGLLNDAPEARMAPVGVCTFSLNNAHDNEGLTRSWYSPGHANVRTGFGRGTPIRVSLYNEALDLGAIHFIGTLVEIQPTTGIYGDRITHCIAYDWMREAAKFNLDGIETQENITADEVLTLILMRMQNKPHDISFAGGSDLFPIALDNTKDEKAYAQSEFGKLMLSELGLLYITGDGTFTFESRSSRGALTAIDHEFDNAMSDAEADASSGQIINRVRATVHPRRVDAAATTVLFETTNRVAIDAGNTKTFFQFRDPTQQAARFGGLDVNMPAAGVDYTFNTQADGLGLDVTSDPSVVVTFEISGSGIYATIANGYGLRLYLQLEVTGRGVYDFEPVTIIEENAASIDSVGVNEVSLDMPYQTDAPIGQGAALQILNVYQSEQTRLKTVTFPARKNLDYLALAIGCEISQRMHALEEMAGIDGEFFINAIKISWNADKDIQVTLFLTPADTQEYWIMDVSQLDISTRLGFA